MSRFLIAVAMLTLVYALTLASFHPIDLAFGALLATVLAAANRAFVFGDQPAPGRSTVGRVLAFVPFAAVLLRQITVSTFEVIAITLALRPRPPRGIVAVPIGERSPLGVAVWAIVTGLPPGSFFVHLDEGRGVVLIHLLDARDPDGYLRRTEAFYRDFQSKVFP